jgi:hypothetical protein
MSGVRQTCVYLDAALGQLAKLRDQLLANPDAPRRAERLAELFTLEARAWSELFEVTSSRLLWRAALAAEAGARQRAALWHGRAVARAGERTDRTSTSVPSKAA